MSVTSRPAADRLIRQPPGARVRAGIRWVVVTLALACVLCLHSALAQDTQGNNVLDNPIPALGASDTTYKLDAGDIVKINVFNHEDLSGDFQAD